jgi:hypothetical protein
VDDQRVGSREVELTVLAVVPLDEIGRLSAVSVNLEDHAPAIGLARSMASHHDVVTYVGVHGEPPPRLLLVKF